VGQGLIPPQEGTERLVLGACPGPLQKFVDCYLRHAASGREVWLMPHHISFANEKPAVAIGTAVYFIAHDLCLFQLSRARNSWHSSPANRNEQLLFRHAHFLAQ
jgi:hypothetical protein